MNVFLDTSTLFKLYHREEGSSELDAFLDEHEIDHFYISEIALVVLEGLKTTLPS